MFRKTWKQIKIAIFVTVIIISLPRSILPRSTQVKEDLDYYVRLNDAEKRLSEYKDDREALALKLAQLGIINKNRKKYNAKPLKLDILASRTANMISRESAENNFTGHWNLAGEKPYHRYAFAGGYDHVTENAYGEWSSEEYENSPQVIAQKMKEGHETFMAERPPRDGHKKAIIDREHNYVGIGYYLEGNQFRYYEEFIDRYFEFEKVPGEVSPGEKTGIRLKTDGKNFLYFMIIYHEDFPKPLTPEEISRRGSYSDFTEEQYLSMPAWELARYRNGPYYEIPMIFKKEGLYYIHIFSDTKEITRPQTISTKGKTPYSGIVIKVKE